MTTQQQIDSLKPGREIEISRVGAIRVTAERSGDGKTVRFVRWTGRNCEVFRTAKW